MSLLFLCFVLLQCSAGGSTSGVEPPSLNTSSKSLADFWLGVDLSYANEMEDCGARFKLNNKPMDVYALFAEAGSNLVRVRLWHNPDWTRYSNFADVSETIERAQKSGQQVLLDFHYSDTWADPQKQYVPAAWKELVGNDKALADALYNYTFEVLENLYVQKSLPEFVQIGNEINAELLQLEAKMDQDNINWQRNALLINHGLQAVADFNKKYQQKVQRYLHVAQPENALWWFEAATKAGVHDYELIGISFYEKWSDYTLESLPQAIASLRNSYNKKVVVLESSYPWTLENFDEANNILAEDSLAPGYPATPQGQLDYLQALLAAIVRGGGSGLVYWEPAWVSTSCSTLWGKGSHWENATLFDEKHNALPSISIFHGDLQEQNKSTKQK